MDPRERGVYDHHPDTGYQVYPDYQQRPEPQYAEGLEVVPPSEPEYDVTGGPQDMSGKILASEVEDKKDKGHPFATAANTPDGGARPWWKRPLILAIIAAAVIIAVGLGVGLGVGLTVNRGDDSQGDKNE